MTGCTRYRRTLLADPRDPEPELRAHRDTCAECAAFTARLLRFEGRLERALRVPLPQGAPISRLRRAGFETRWLAMAASLVLALLVGGGLWVFAPGRSLAADVVTHMKGEPKAWRRTDVAVPTPDLQDVLNDAHLRLSGAPGIVSYASSCRFRGHQVPHLVMQTDSGPVTVMVLVHDPVHRAVRFDEEGYRGVIVPVAGHGSVAVLTQDEDKDRNEDIARMQRLAARVQKSFIWTP